MPKRKNPKPETVQLAPPPNCRHCGGLTRYDYNDDWARCLRCGREEPPPGYKINLKQEGPGAKPGPREKAIA